jgi:hypothetical protein
MDCAYRCGASVMQAHDGLLQIVNVVIWEETAKTLKDWWD